MHEAAPPVAYRPATHVTHAAALVAAVKGFEVPGGQSMHDVWPPLLWYFPTAQDAHDVEPADAEKKPGEQEMQEITLVAPVVPLYVPAAHCVQLMVHVEPDQVPGTQLVQPVAPEPLNEPVPQHPHVADDVAPTALLNLPAPQSVHEEAPVAGPAYLPATHCAQVLDEEQLAADA